MSAIPPQAPIFVVGAGIMGLGITQVAAQAGHPVRLFDAREGAAAAGKARLSASLDALASKGKLTVQDIADAIARIEVVPTLAFGADAGLAIEAIVEDLAAKRHLFVELEALVSPDCVFATNTSSISVSAIANGLRRPERLVGMHFFNPAPLMRLVEVVSGMQTDVAVAESIFDLAQRWGKTAVHARSTPGFIVNRIARPYYAEALALLQERASSAADIDRCLRAAGFRMGPCELMDLIGHDTNLAVTESIYAANYFDKRFVPSLVQRELVDGGLLGRKAGRGFFDYRQQATPVHLPEVKRPRSELPLCASIRSTNGHTASQIANAEGLANVAVLDWHTGAGDGTLAYSVAMQAAPGFAQEVESVLAHAGFRPVRTSDSPGLVVARTLAMLSNEAADAVQQGVCTEAGANLAMKLGVNYPVGPFEWVDRFGAGPIVTMIDNLAFYYRNERYRVSPWLRERCRTTDTPTKPNR